MDRNKFIIKMNYYKCIYLVFFLCTSLLVFGQSDISDEEFLPVRTREVSLSGKMCQIDTNVFRRVADGFDIAFYQDYNSCSNISDYLYFDSIIYKIKRKYQYYSVVVDSQYYTVNIFKLKSKYRKENIDCKTTEVPFIAPGLYTYFYSNNGYLIHVYTFLSIPAKKGEIEKCSHIMDILKEATVQYLSK